MKMFKSILYGLYAGLYVLLLIGYFLLIQYVSWTLAIILSCVMFGILVSLSHYHIIGKDK